MKVIYVDIDETICETPHPRNYFNAQPIKENIEKINKLYDEGNTIVYWTARGSRTQINWYDLTKSQLDEWGVKYHELYRKSRKSIDFTGNCKNRRGSKKIGFLLYFVWIHLLFMYLLWRTIIKHAFNFIVRTFIIRRTPPNDCFQHCDFIS